MTEKTEKKKKIYQVAKEINISHENIIAHLKKKGHEVSGINSVVTDAMMADITDHFKKDREVAEKHQKKIAVIRETRDKVKPKKDEPAAPAGTSKTRTKKKGDEAEAEAPLTPAEIPAPVVEAPAPAETAPAKPVHEEPAVVEPETVELPVVEPVEEPEPVPIAAETVTPEPVEPETAEPEVIEPVEVPAPKAKTKEAPYLMPRRTPKMGLTVMGKIDLDAVNKAAAAADKPTAKAAEEAAEKKKKKKKRRLKTDAPVAAPTEEAGEDTAKKGKKKKKLKHAEVDQEEVKEAIKRTLAEMDDASQVAQRAALKKKRKEKRAAEEQRHIEALERDKSVLRVTEFVTVNELASLMGVNVAEVIKKCIGLGLMVSINQRLESDTIQLVADEFGYSVNFTSEDTEELLANAEEDDEAGMETRPPVVTIMGHVDHGKTSLLDYIRSANVVAGESGGITQHIGAYLVNIADNKQIAFLDTPGHEAFTAMRARGAQVTDIVVLVVAADDSVMPQTVEAISHAQAAGVPIIIAINKTDKPEAAPDRIRQQLADRNVLVEEWGGKYQSVELSARSGKNVDVLLEKILLEAEVLNLKANPNRKASGVVIEAQVDKGKGIIATVLVQRGTLHIGESFVAGIQSGRVRAMFDERGKRVEFAKPSTPVQLIGFDGIPQAGDGFAIVEDERQAREISLRRQQLKRQQDLHTIKAATSLDDLSQQISEGQIKDLNVIVKGDVDGSVGALADSLMKIQHAEVRVNVIHRAVGAISESDVLLAAASGAVIIGFHVRPHPNARRLAEKEHVDIRLYSIIYDAINDVKKALEGLLAPEKKEEVTATVEVRDVFKVPKIGAVAGCYVQEGKITRGNMVRIIRDGIQIFEGSLTSLKRFKDDVREVEQGFECGMGFENFNDVKVGDIVEAFKVVETMRKLV